MKILLCILLIVVLSQHMEKNLIELIGYKTMLAYLKYQNTCSSPYILMIKNDSSIINIKLRFMNTINVISIGRSDSYDIEKIGDPYYPLAIINTPSVYYPPLQQYSIQRMLIHSPNRDRYAAEHGIWSFWGEIYVKEDNVTITIGPITNTSPYDFPTFNNNPKIKLENGYNKLRLNGSFLAGMRYDGADGYYELGIRSNSYTEVHIHRWSIGVLLSKCNSVRCN